MGLVRSVVCYYCLGGCNALVVCSQRLRQVRGVGPVRALASPLVSPSSLALLAVRVAGCPARVSPPFPCRYAIPCSLCVPRARSGCSTATYLAPRGTQTPRGTSPYTENTYPDKVGPNPWKAPHRVTGQHTQTL